jgi:tetratricopeptide (TPR) repeat protein
MAYRAFINPFHAAAVIGTLSIGVCSVLTASGLWQSAWWPLVWPDVALVYWLCLLAVAAAVVAAASCRVKEQLAPLVVAVMVLLCFPPFYIQARIGSEAKRAYALIEESRYGEAHLLLSQILRLRPDATWQGVKLREADDRLGTMIEPIEARVRLPLEATADHGVRVARAQDLAVLGRTEESLAVLGVPSALVDLPEACVLRGAIHEAHGRWGKARDCFAQAIVSLSREEVATASYRLPLQSKALAGIGHCERKLGRLQEAEAAYTTLLAITPTAQTHFLVAQFYEDTQQTALAKAHARKALALAPEQYRESVSQLETRLATTHFGCLAAFGGR